jgi:hypothetical protein
VTDPLVSPELLAALPIPWRLTNSYERVKAMQELPPVPQQRDVALSALEASLAYATQPQARHDEKSDWDLPPGFFGDWFFLLHAALERSMPTLADVTREKVHDWAEQTVDAKAMFGADWTTPPEDFVDNVGRMWVYSTVVGAIEPLVRWFRQVARAHLTDDQRFRVVELLRMAAPHLSWWQAIDVLPAILDLGGPEQRDYFDRLANNPDLPEKTREEAASLRWLIDRDNPVA